MLNRSTTDWVSAVIIALGSLALLTTAPGETIAAEQASGCCYADCMHYCMQDKPNTGHEWTLCHNTCNADCEACPE